MANTVTAKGNASFSINDLETEAKLTFVPDSAGNDWDVAAVKKLAAENRLTVNPDVKALEAFLQKASGSTEPAEMIFAKGVDPEEPVSETVNWESLSIPQDMASFQEETLAKAGPPRIVKIKVEKIKHETTVKKPASLPFMPAKEETEVSWEKKETPEEVTVNPQVKEVKYADKGIKLGTVSPGTPGKIGKSISGKPISPKKNGDGEFLFGEGIERNKNNELTATVSGFIRIGEGWADMVFLAKPSWSINTGVDGLTLFLHFEPGDARFPLPKGEEILAAAASKGAAPESLISADEINAAIADAAKNKEPLEAFSLFQIQNAEARVDINPDKTRAALFLHKGVAGALPLDNKAVTQAVKDSGVQGYNAEKLKTDIQAFMEGKELALKDYVLVEGTPSTRGKDRELEIVVVPLSPDQQKLYLSRVKTWKETEETEQEGISPEKATGLALVEKGAVVARVSAGSEGEPGKDIYGNVIPGLPGNDPDITLFRGLELHGSDICASQNGLLLLETPPEDAAKNTFHGEVIDYKDAKITVHISDDAMEARGDLFREEGAGVPLSLDNVLKVLGALGVKKGINPENVEKACVLARTGGIVSGYVFARGELPVAKGGQAVTWLLPVEVSGPFASEPDKTDAVPVDVDLPTEVSAEAPLESFPESGGGAEVSAPPETPAPKTLQVKAGDAIAELSEPVAEGRPGYDVKGTEIPVENAVVLVIAHDDSIREVALQKGKRLVVARPGDLSFDGKSLRIDSVKTIQGDIGPSTGGVKFSGELRIHGNILPGCAVIGGANVTVDGVAEEALISSGGKVVVTLGSKGGGKGIIRAKTGIETDFTERTAIMALGNILLKRGSILSKIKTNGKVVISSENGKLTGGFCQARLGIDAEDIGSEKGVRTEISFGQDYLVKDQIGACEEEIAKVKLFISRIDEKVNAALKKKLPLSDNIRSEKVKLLKLMEQLKLKVFNLREKFEEHHESEVRVRGTVFPGVVIESHNRYYEVQQKRSQVIFYFDRESGIIKEKPLS